MRTVARPGMGFPPGDDLFRILIMYQPAGGSL